MTDIGVSCHKNSYGRGVGKVLTCTKDQEEDAALCYDFCNYGADGVGPVCWGHCPANTVPCGDFLCLDEVEVCSESIVEDTANIGKLVIDIAIGSASGTIIDISKIFSDYDYPECPSW